MGSPRADLIRRLAEQEARLAVIERDREAALVEIEALRRELEARPAPQPPEERIRPFRSLSRGGADVFPTRFVSEKTGKPGYAPACADKFVRGVGDPPRDTCGERPNQAFGVVDDQAVLGHLMGRHVMGVYPMLEAETCRQMGAPPR
jgi:hypothetical protein